MSALCWRKTKIIMMKKILAFSVCVVTVLCLLCGCSNLTSKTNLADKKRSLTDLDFINIASDLGFTEIEEQEYASRGMKNIRAQNPNSVAFIEFNIFSEGYEEDENDIYEFFKSEIDSETNKGSGKRIITTGKNYETYQGRIKKEEGIYELLHESKVDNTVLFIWSVYGSDGQGQDLIDAFGY